MKEDAFRSHTALLLSTALPFLTPAYRHPVELAAKFLEFSETLHFYQEFHPNAFSLGSSLPEDDVPKESGFFGLLNSFVIDLEGLLTALAKVCTGDAREMISLFLNLIRAKKFYEMYGDIIQTMMPGMQGSADYGLFGFTGQGSAGQPDDDGQPEENRPAGENTRQGNSRQENTQWETNRRAVSKDAASGSQPPDFLSLLSLLSPGLMGASPLSGQQTPQQNMKEMLQKETQQNMQEMPQQETQQASQQNIQEMLQQNAQQASQQNLQKTPQRNMQEMLQQNAQQASQQNMQETPQQNTQQVSQQNIQETPQQNIQEMPQQETQQTSSGILRNETADTPLFASMMNDEQKETLDLLKTLLESEES